VPAAAYLGDCIKSSEKTANQKTYKFILKSHAQWTEISELQQYAVLLDYLKRLISKIIYTVLFVDAVIKFGSFTHAK